MDILIFTIEDGRFGPARLPQMFQEAGLSVAALCPADNILASSSFLSTLHALPPSRNIRSLARSLAGAIDRSRPSLIIPGDEQAVVLLQAFAGGRCKSLIGPKARSIIAASLGDPAGYAASLFKSDTMELARHLGISVPPGQTVQTADDAVRVAERLGFPVYLKQSFSWAGRGVERCDDAAALRTAVHAARPRGARVRAIVRKGLGRDWYPTVTAMDVQAGIDGDTAMFSAFAWRGRLIGGHSGLRLATIHVNGPSSAVRLGHDSHMADAAAKMVAALGFTGFLSFDFMVPSDGTVPVLLECNPRPVPVHHLGRYIGVDLAAAVARLLEGESVDGGPMFANRDLDVVLFPHALDPAQSRQGCMADVPHKDPGLIRHFVEGRKAEHMGLPESLAA